MAQGFAGIASGQKGMTYVLESFVNHVGKPIERQYGLEGQGLLGGCSREAIESLTGGAPALRRA